jgi:DNA polymerase III subunit alpha
VELSWRAPTRASRRSARKKQDLIDANREKFLAGSQEKGLTVQEADELWNLITKFAGYGFNKSHSTAYALIAYQTAYPEGTLSRRVHGGSAFGRYSRAEFQEEGFTGRAPGRLPADEDRSRPPDVNSSDHDFSVKDEQDLLRPLRHQGMRRLGGRGDRPGTTQERTLSGSYDFCERAEVTRAIIETLIKAGRFRFHGGQTSPTDGSGRPGASKPVRRPKMIDAEVKSRF